jgi:hypothetical protein
MAKTLKTGKKNKSTKKVVRRSKNKTSHKKTTTKLQKGGAIDWGRYIAVEELSIADIVRDNQDDVHVENDFGRQICKFTRGQFNALKTTINQNNNLKKLNLSQHFITIEDTRDPYFIPTISINELLNSFQPLSTNLKHLNLNCTALHADGRQLPRLPFNTDVLVDFFNKHRSVNLDELDLRGWKFSPYGLYNLSDFECSGRVLRLLIDNNYPEENKDEDPGKTIIYGSYIKGNMAQTIKDNFKKHMRQLKEMTYMRDPHNFKREDDILNKDLLNVAGLNKYFLKHDVFDKSLYAKVEYICTNIDKVKVLYDDDIILKKDREDFVIITHFLDLMSKDQKEVNSTINGLAQIIAERSQTRYNGM